MEPVPVMGVQGHGRAPGVGRRGACPGGPRKPSQLAEGTPREQGGWPGAGSPSLKLLLGLAARPGALRKARSRLLCCLASCSMVSSRWMRCSCSYCRARCHFRLCVSASSRKSLQAWWGGWPVSREGGPGGPSPKGSETPALPPVPVTGSGDPRFLRASLASALVGSPHAGAIPRRAQKHPHCPLCLSGVGRPQVSQSQPGVRPGWQPALAYTGRGFTV